jgi:hypothetical protein
MTTDNMTKRQYELAEDALEPTKLARTLEQDERDPDAEGQFGPLLVKTLSGRVPWSLLSFPRARGFWRRTLAKVVRLTHSPRRSSSLAAGRANDDSSGDAQRRPTPSRFENPLCETETEAPF